MDNDDDGFPFIAPLSWASHALSALHISAHVTLRIAQGGCGYYARLTVEKTDVVRVTCPDHAGNWQSQKSKSVPESQAHILPQNNVQQSQTFANKIVIGGIIFSYENMLKCLICLGIKI